MEHGEETNLRAELQSGLWRPITPADDPAVIAIGNRVHLAYPEDPAVFMERHRLYPAGCAVFESDGEIQAYALTHPWIYAEPPALNAMLGALPVRPTTYYIHDIALLPETRGSGAGRAIVEAVLAHAGETGMTNVSLVAVNNSQAFWKRFGFEVVAEEKLAAKLKSYDDDARFMVRRL